MNQPRCRPLLPHGDYAFFIRQTGGLTEYQFESNASLVPEPETMILLGFAGSGIWERHWFAGLTQQKPMTHLD